MLPLKLLRSLVSGDDVIATPISSHPRNKTPLLLFTPSQELIKDTYRLSQIARAIGMDLHPNPSLSHIFFSWPSQNDAVPLPFPSFATASLSHLRLFAALSKGFFKLAFCCIPAEHRIESVESLSNRNWHRSSLSLFAYTGERIDSMDRLSRVLLGKGWSLFTTNNGEIDSVYLYRKLDVSRISNRNSDLGECSRVRDLRLPPLEFGNVPLRILQYILLMTDDIFYLA